MKLGTDKILLQQKSLLFVLATDVHLVITFYGSSYNVTVVTNKHTYRPDTHKERLRDIHTNKYAYEEADASVRSDMHTYAITHRKAYRHTENSVHKSI